MMQIEPDNWYYSPEHGKLCRVIESQTLWGETVCRVWLPPGKDSIVRLPAKRLWPVHEASIGTWMGSFISEQLCTRSPRATFRRTPSS